MFGGSVVIEWGLERGLSHLRPSDTSARAEGRVGCLLVISVFAESGPFER